MLPGEDIVFDVRHSDVPTGHDGLFFWGFDLQYDPLVSYQSFHQLDSWFANDPSAHYGEENLPEGWSAKGFAGFGVPSIDGNVPLLELSFRCEGLGTAEIIPTWHWGYIYIGDIDD